MEKNKLDHFKKSWQQIKEMLERGINEKEE